jgi:uncharacterized membrane-anchored protein
VPCFFAYAQQGQQEPSIKWQKGLTTADLGGIAKIKIPEGFLYTDKKGTQKLLEMTQNIPSGNEVGAITPDGQDDKDAWFVTFEFHEVGFVKDDEKNTLDSAAILDSIKEGTEQANEARKQHGWPAFHVVGWQKSPFYDPETHNLTWAILGKDDKGGQAVNHSIRILGRHGTMNVDLVMTPEQYAQTVPHFNTLMTSFEFQQGRGYADFAPGDKVAGYGLTALIAGGAGAIAVKTGLLAKAWKFVVMAFAALWKFLVALFIAIGAALKKFWARFRDKSKENQSVHAPMPHA